VIRLDDQRMVRRRLAPRFGADAAWGPAQVAHAVDEVTVG